MPYNLCDCRMSIEKKIDYLIDFHACVHVCGIVLKSFIFSLIKLVCAPSIHSQKFTHETYKNCVKIVYFIRIKRSHEYISYNVNE